MATSSSSVSSSSPTASPKFRRPADPTSSAVAAAAAGRLSPPPSPTTAHLSGAEPPKNPAAEKYAEARRLLSAGKAVEARTLFLELIESFSRDESKLINSADCHIGVAYSYPQGSPDRDKHALEAKRSLDAALFKAREGDPANEETVCAIQPIRVLYEELALLFPKEHEAIHQNITARIKECSAQIPVLVNFYEKLAYANRVQDQPEQARRILNEVMPTILGSDNDGKAEFILARAIGYLKLAFTFSEGDDDRNRLSLDAQKQTFAAYDHKEELYTNEKAKLFALSCFNRLFDGLSRLIPSNQAIHPQIMEKLAECRRELSSLRPADGQEKTPSDRTVTPDPVDDYWKPARIFIAFTIAAAVIVGAVFLGRRLITKLN